MNERTIISGNLPLIESRVTISWQWQDEGNGLIEWTFDNNDAKDHSVVLYRSGYYFAGAFWPIYVNNGMTKWLTSISPLQDRRVDQNSPPLAPVEFPDDHKQIMFIFTLSPQQKWSMLEGGFVNGAGPTGIRLFEVLPIDSAATDYCIGYDNKQAIDWDAQTKTTMKPYEPNPETFKTMMFRIQPGAPDIRLFPRDSVRLGTC